jgi:hypothetical protein
MESALVRQPRVSPAAPRTGRAARIALGLAGTVLAAGIVVLQPFAAFHLFPARKVSSPAAALPPTPQGDVTTTSGALPIAPEPASEPPRLAPGGAVTGPPVPLLFAAPNSSPASASLAQPAVAVASTPAAEPPPQAAPPAPLVPPILPAASGDSPAPPAPLTMPVVPPSEPAATPLGAPPPPREPLPLETDLIGSGSPPGSPLGSPGVGAITRPDQMPAAGVAPETKPVAAGRHG